MILWPFKFVLLLIPLPKVFLSILLKLLPAFPEDTSLTMALYLNCHSALRDKNYRYKKRPHGPAHTPRRGS